MKDNKLVIAYYDFDYVEDDSRFTEDEFNNLRSEDYMTFQVYTCQDYNVPPIFEYNELVKLINTDDIDDIDEDICNVISEITGWCVESIEFKDC